MWKFLYGICVLLWCPGKCPYSCLKSQDNRRGKAQISLKREQCAGLAHWGLCDMEPTTRNHSPAVQHPAQQQSCMSSRWPCLLPTATGWPCPRTTHSGAISCPVCIAGPVLLQGWNILNCSMELLVPAIFLVPKSHSVAKDLFPVKVLMPFCQVST